MLKVNIIAVGSIKEKFYKEAIEEYKKRLGRFCKLAIIEVDEQSNLPESKKIEEESRLLESQIRGYSILLDRQGKMLSSEEFAKKIGEVSQQGMGELSLIIGGSNGVSQALKDKVNMLVSFGKITYPHQLFRVLLLEQTYRAFTINASLPYHK